MSAVPIHPDSFSNPPWPVVPEQALGCPLVVHDSLLPGCVARLFPSLSLGHAGVAEHLECPGHIQGCRGVLREAAVLLEGVFPDSGASLSSECGPLYL